MPARCPSPSSTFLGAFCEPHSSVIATFHAKMLRMRFVFKNVASSGLGSLETSTPLGGLAVSPPRFARQPSHGSHPCLIGFLPSTCPSMKRKNGVSRLPLHRRSSAWAGELAASVSRAREAKTMVWSREQKRALKRLRVQDFDSDLRFWSSEKLRGVFAAASSGRVLTRVLVRNLIYQAATRILSEQAPPIEGNLRSLYYQWVKPVAARLPEVQRQRGDPYDVMIDELERLIVGLQLWRYRDLELVDENWENRFLSDGRAPDVLLYAEKTGFVLFLQRAARRYGLTAVALGGSPSHLSAEYLTTQLREALGEVPALRLVAVTDYDPSGLFIQRAFKEQLHHHGLAIAEHHSLIAPDAFTKQERALLSYAVPSKQPKRVQGWLDDTGGLDGQARGIEADALPKDRLRERLDRVLQPFLDNTDT